jgi:hypothetical protein
MVYLPEIADYDIVNSIKHDSNLERFVPKKSQDYFTKHW